MRAFLWNYTHNFLVFSQLKSQNCAHGIDRNEIQFCMTLKEFARAFNFVKH